MLKVCFGDMEGVLHNVETFFKNQMEYEWLESDIAKKIIEDVFIREKLAKDSRPTTL